MAELTIKPVETRAERRQFVDLAWQLYRDDENWIPPLRRNLEELVGFRKHPFHDVATSARGWPGETGRPWAGSRGLSITTHNEKYNEKRGFFGFFESVDDQEVASGLFDTVRAWLGEQGITDLRGPVNPSLNYEIGLLIDGFDSPPTFMMTYNPPYYARLIEDYGFGKSQDLYAFWGHVDMLATLDKKLEFIINEATRRFEIKLRFLDRSRSAKMCRRFLHIYNASLEGTLGIHTVVAGRDRAYECSLATSGRSRVDDGGRSGRPAGGGRLRAAGLQSADQADRRPAVPVWVSASVDAPQKDQSGSSDQHQCACRNTSVGEWESWSWPGCSRCAEMGDPGGRVLLGTGEQSSLLQVAETRGSEADQDYRIYDYPAPRE